MPDIHLLDTNVLLFDPQSLFAFPRKELMLPIEVLDELDQFKHGSDETSRNARTAANLLDDCRRRGSLREGVTLENGAHLRIVAVGRNHNAGEALLKMARQLTEAGHEAVIITNSVKLRIKADALGLPARDYGNDTPMDTEKALGWLRMKLPEEEMKTLRDGHPIELPGNTFHPNQYLAAVSAEDSRSILCARYCAADHRFWPIKDPFRKHCGLKSLNIEQTFCLDALSDPAIPLVTLAGRAGTGKTLLAIAAALQQIFGEQRYHKLLVFRPTMPVSRDLGFLPGDIGEKMRPWMQPVYDALELLRSLDRKGAARTLPNDLQNCPEVSVEPLTYIRGRSIPNQFIIIDEAQNLTPLEVKTAITRVGHGSKIVLTGDPAQIDNPYVDCHTNGLTRLVTRFLSSPLAAHITLRHGERSELAETASSLL